MIVTGHRILKRARQEGYGVGAFNFTNLEVLRAIIEAAEELEAPVICETSEGQVRYMTPRVGSALFRAVMHRRGIPAVLHLDHGKSMRTVRECVKHGWTSAMLDSSDKPFEENIRATRVLVAFARKHGISTEAELGVLREIRSKEDLDYLTKPEEAEEFVERTGVDSLAVAIGTAHGKFKNPNPKIDFDRLKEISELVPIPLVLHGSSGVPERDLKKAVSLGISKVNISTDLRTAFTGTIRKILEDDPECYKPHDYLVPAIEAVKEVVRRKIRALGSEGVASSKR